MGKPCEHRGAVEGCRVCWLFEHRAKYRGLWGRSGRCVYLGTDTGERKPCDSCNGRVQLKLFRCGHANHPEPVTLRDCQTCSDHAEYRKEEVTLES